MSTPSTSASRPESGGLAKIFWISVLGLFLELLMIRWIGTEVRIFAYLQNTILVVCFLGLGMGCFTAARPARLATSLVCVLTLTVLLALPATREGLGTITKLLSVLDDLVIWNRGIAQGPVQAAGLVTLGLAMTFLLLVLVWEAFVPIGRLLGRWIEEHPRTIQAYSVNVAGSLVGIWLLVALGALSAPPFVWLCVLALCFLLVAWRGRERRAALALLFGTLAFGFLTGLAPGALEVRWSPYQKLVLHETSRDHPIWPGEYLVSVNNTGYQGMIDLGPASARSGAHGLSQYDVPLRFHPEPERVLIVGAGTGNDVAGALRGGAGEVVAVEIDPVILDLGRRYHPEEPYASPRVRIVEDDARSFFATSDERFDLIIFGLLDSHTTTAMTNARLDHYVYTRESLQAARGLLAEGGVAVLSFEANKDYIADRIGRSIRDVFGGDPLAFRVPGSASGWGGLFFVAGDRESIRSCLSADAELAKAVAAWQAEHPLELPYTTEVVTDDWPYLYLESRSIPTLYFLLGGLMLALLVYARLRLATSIFRGWGLSHWHFFFLGAAFLLLEVQNISKAAVVFGSTWIVNAVIISAILVMILLANVVAARLPRLSPRPVGALLCGSCVGLYFVDMARFATLPFLPRVLVVGALATLPVFFAGILFVRSFADVERKDLALGANLLGALVGGLLQSVTFLTGIRALLLLVAVLYAAAVATRPRSRGRGVGRGGGPAVRDAVRAA